MISIYNILLLSLLAHNDTVAAAVVLAQIHYCPERLLSYIF